MFHLKRTILLVVGLLVAGLLAPTPMAEAQDQDSAAQRTPDRRYTPVNPPPWWIRGRGMGPGPGGVRDREDWSEVEAFMKQYSPRRWEMYQKLPPERQQQIQITVYRRYRLMQWFKSSDSEVYELQKTRWILGDEIFALSQELKSRSANEQTRQKLREKIGQFVDLGVQERKMRISRWEKMIANERELIAHETRDRDQIIKNRMLAAEQNAGNLGDEDPEATTQESPQTPAIASPTTAPVK